MYQWDARGHVALADTYMHAPQREGSVLDYFHVNSIEPLPGGKLLISSRNTWAVYMVSAAHGTRALAAGRHAGAPSPSGPGSSSPGSTTHRCSRTGPSASSTTMPRPPRHASRARSTSRSTSAPTPRRWSNRSSTRATASSPTARATWSPSANGDDFIGWGQWGEASELSAAGQLTFDLKFAYPANSYRAYRYAWNAQPETEPAVAVAAPTAGATQLYVSWNGATGVASWQVLAGPTPTSLAVVGTYPTGGFETAISAPTAGPYLQVQALAADGTVLQHSAVVKN